MGTIKWPRLFKVVMGVDRISWPQWLWRTTRGKLVVVVLLEVICATIPLVSTNMHGCFVKSIASFSKIYFNLGHPIWPWLVWVYLSHSFDRGSWYFQCVAKAEMAYFTLLMGQVANAGSLPQFVHDNWRQPCHTLFQILSGSDLVVHHTPG